jgi:hypothetical protein
MGECATFATIPRAGLAAAAHEVLNKKKTAYKFGDHTSLAEEG